MILGKIILGIMGDIGVMKIKIIVFLVVLVIIGNVLKIFINESEKPKVEINESDLVYKKKSNELSYEKVDINKAEYEDFISVGFTKSQAEKLMKYKDFAGDIYSLDELPRIKGFGKSSIEKANNILYVSEGKKVRNKHNINKLSETELKLLGFNNKEIKKLSIVLKKSNIRTNIELIDIVGIEKYEEVEKSVKYVE